MHFTYAVAAALVLAVPAAGQQESTIRATAKLFGGEVDGLVRQLRYTANHSGALADGSCRQTAMVITAAGHCHRFYCIADGPWLRNAVQSLFRHRRDDGAFTSGEGDDMVLTTRWVMGALEVMEPKVFAQDIERCRSFLIERGAAPTSPFVEHTTLLQKRAIASGDPVGFAEKLGSEALATLPRDPSQAPAPQTALDALLQLVTAQVIARGQYPQGVAPVAGEWSPVQQKAMDFLLTQQKEGVFYYAGKFPDAGLTGLGLAALATKPRDQRTDAESTDIEKGLTWLLSQQNDDGSFGKTNLNYTTCAAVKALAKANEPRSKEPLAKAQRFLLFLQNVDDKGYSPSDRDYGSIGYGGSERGDLSNLQFALEALTKTGIDKQHEAFQKALVFLQRTQNLRNVNTYNARTRDEEGNWENVGSGNDGGAAYYPGNSPAGYLTLADGTRVPRSYGSMTYSLLKAYILCGLPADDQRVQAAVTWIRDHFTVDENPGADPKLGEKTKYQGLYYYYLVMAEALNTVGLDSIGVTRGDKTDQVDWRKALSAKLASLQGADGSWLNEKNGRWWEDQKMLCTIYAMLALEHCNH